MQLGQQLLRLARQVDALEGRFASAMGHRPPGAREAAADAEERLAALEKGLSASSAGAACGSYRRRRRLLSCGRHWWLAKQLDVVTRAVVLWRTARSTWCHAAWLCCSARRCWYGCIAMHDFWQSLTPRTCRAAALPRRIAAVAERAQARLDGSQNHHDGNGSGEAAALDEASLRSLLSLLKQQQSSLAALEVGVSACDAIHGTKVWVVARHCDATQ